MIDHKVVLVGNPNCGKTALINALTGSRLRVGNWPGVTVEKKSGFFLLQNKKVEVVDLPGTYSLVANNGKTSIDEIIAVNYINEHPQDIIINVIDALNLERNLFLTTQLIDLERPMIVALNMMDLAERERIKINVNKLSSKLGCPVIPIVSVKNKGIDLLKQCIVNQQQKIPLTLSYPQEITQAINSIQKISQLNKALALRLLEGDLHVFNSSDLQLQENIEKIQEDISKTIEETDILIADSRYDFAHSVRLAVIEQESQSKTNLTEKIDRIVLNRFLGIPIFLVIMYLMFLFAINIGGAFQDFFDIGTDTIFVQGFAHLLQSLNMPNWIIALLASGAGKGINTTVTFIPVIGGMFLFLAFLEDSGYMARAAFVMDRFMRALGLPGKSFVPMIVGFGCNVPAIMAARTLDSRRDRILTIMMSPFMSCGARLAIFAVFTAAFFPRGGQNVVFALYIIGILTAVITGLLLRKTILQGEPSPFIMELPPYHIPTLRAIWQQTWARLKRFLFKAGKFIIPICILIGALNSLTITGGLVGDNGSGQTLLSWLGRELTPLFSPFGLHQDNWPATVGLLTGTLAKEVVVATLNTLYTQVGHFTTTVSHFNFWSGLHAAVMSVPHNLAALPHALGNPVLASAPDHSVNHGVYGLMYQRFNGQAAAFSYLLFVLLYIPCVSTTAVMIRELDKKWATFSVLWSVGLAYGVAVIFYQVATLSHHPYSSIAWISGICVLFLGTITAMRFYANHTVSSSQMMEQPV